MKKLTKKQIGKPAAVLIITALVFAGTSALHLRGAFRFPEYKSYDLRVRLLAPYSRPSDEIVVILLDQDSIDWAQRERGWSWPWPRQAYAELVEYMNRSEARSVAFDVIFSEPSVYRNAAQDAIIDEAVAGLETLWDSPRENVQNAPRGNPPGSARPDPGRFGVFRNIINALRTLSSREDDASFARAAGNFGQVVQTIFFSTQTGNVSSWPPELDTPLFQAENFGPMLERFTLSAGGEWVGAQLPIPELRESAGALGCITGEPDSDGILRRMRLFTLFDGRAVPGLAAASLLVSGRSPQISYDAKRGRIAWDDFSVPVNHDGSSILRYRGELARYAPYSAMHILQSAEALKRGEEPLLPPDNFKNTYVFFGFYAPGLFDIFSAPFSSVYPGMGAHITMLDNLLQGDFIRETPQWTNLLILLAAVGLTAALTLFSGRIPLAVGGTILIAAMVITGSFAAYHWGSFWVPMVSHLAGIIAAFITVTLYNYATEGSQKRFIKSAFSQYLSPKVIEQIIADPSQLKLGGEKQEMTAIFTDIRSFSTISEALGDPAKLVELLNHYLTRMSNIVHDNQGTIDKYEGDAIIAFFGAPVRLPNHASLACRAAVKMKKAEAAINREALAQGLITGKVMDALVSKGILQSTDDPQPLFTRLGINTGDMVVGNMGTPNKMNYTIMGNAVNLAARLEGVNKQYNTGGILISEYTRAHIGDEFILRPLSRVRVVGINTPLRLYELLDIRDEAAPELLAMVKSWEQGFAAYEKREFLAAQNIFHMIHLRNSADLAAKKYLDRCTRYLAAPPDQAAWDNGVDNLTEK